jgi:hypothetical protein
MGDIIDIETPGEKALKEWARVVEMLGSMSPARRDSAARMTRCFGSIVALKPFARTVG